MCASMAVRAVSWSAILRAALPGRAAAAGDALQGTMIGVLMSRDAARPAWASRRAR